ncbi:MAG: hypothetical protein CMN60_04930 [Sphingobium sp.]|nr:hypothetical protein [Sphingobium sp.]
MDGAQRQVLALSPGVDGDTQSGGRPPPDRHIGLIDQILEDELWLRGESMVIPQKRGDAVITGNLEMDVHRVFVLTHECHIDVPGTKFLDQPGR